MYWLLYSVFLLPVCFISKKQEEKYLFYFFSIVLIAILTFRFGVGVDYYNYYDIFKSYEINSNWHAPVEPLFGFLCYIFNYFHIPFIVFMGVISLFSSIPIIITIYKKSEKPLISLFIFFTMYYSVYLESAIRAGCAMSLFIYAYFKYLREGKHKKYFLISFIAIGFHYTAIVFLLIPFLRKINTEYYINYMKYFMFLLIFIILSFAMKFLLPIIIQTFIPKYSSYLYNDTFSISYITICLCILRIIIIYYLIRNFKLNKKEIFDLKIYFTGILIYLLLSFYSIASRFTDYFFVLEIFILPRYIKNTLLGKIRLILFLFFFEFMLIKDIRSFLIFGDYYKKNLFGYKYVSVFNKHKILDYRVINPNGYELLK